MIVGFVSAMTTFFFIYIAFDTFVYDRIDQRIKDPTYIQELSKTLRPFLMFNQQGIIIYDHGATKFVDSINVIISFNKNYKINSINEIKVYCNHFLHTAPLLDYIGVYQYTYDVNRAKNYSWVFKMKPMLVLELGGSPEPNENIFTLEILQ